MLARISLLGHFVALALGAIGPQATLHIANSKIAPDGNRRSAVLAGAGPDSLSFPGPVIQATKGDNFSLDVINALKDARMLRTTSIHWHGILQSGTPWADGPVGVTQCPIQPGYSFLYQFSAAHQAGTFWYHSHDRSQYCDGLRGAMVVYDPQDPHLYRYDVDNEDTIITLADWYHRFAPDIEVLPGPQQGFNSTLINGKGRYRDGPLVPLAVIHVQQNRRYRFRIVSVSCSPAFTFSIDGHEMMVIEADGESTQPLVVDSIQIHAGQRYSVVVNANQPVGNYWTRSIPSRAAIEPDARGINLAILRYQNATEEDPTTSPTSNPRMLVESDLRPLRRIEGLDGPAKSIDMPTALVNGLFTFGPEGGSFEDPSVPVLLQILSGRDPLELVPPESVGTLEPDTLYELTIPGSPASEGGPHPMHLHGHVFSVVRSAGVNAPLNLIDPVRRDVVNTGGPDDKVTIRFTTDNPGPWILHCHIDWHLVHGLAYIFAENTSAIVTMDPPVAWDKLCPPAPSAT